MSYSTSLVLRFLIEARWTLLEKSVVLPLVIKGHEFYDILYRLRYFPQGHNMKFKYKMSD